MMSQATSHVGPPLPLTLRSQQTRAGWIPAPRARASPSQVGADSSAERGGAVLRAAPPEPLNCTDPFYAVRRYPRPPAARAGKHECVCDNPDAEFAIVGGAYTCRDCTANSGVLVYDRITGRMACGA
jgi:hypothetical protein